MDISSLNEALSQEMNETLKKIMSEISQHRGLSKFVESVRPEVFLYKNSYSIMVVLRSKLSNDQQEFAMEAIKTIASNYNAKVKRNKLMVKILLKQNKDVEDKEL